MERVIKNVSVILLCAEDSQSPIRLEAMPCNRLYLDILLKFCCDGPIWSHVLMAPIRNMGRLWGINRDIYDGVV